MPIDKIQLTATISLTLPEVQQAVKDFVNKNYEKANEFDYKCGVEFQIITTEDDTSYLAGASVLYKKEFKIDIPPRIHEVKVDINQSPTGKKPAKLRKIKD